MNKLIIIRGPSGSGKSTKAKEIIAANPGTLHYEADMFFYDKEGKYNFDPTKLKYAHAWCQRKVREALDKGHTVIVSNTSIRLWEVNTYIDLANSRGIPYEILTMKGRYKNVHGCPQEKVDEMWKNLAEIPDTYGQTTFIDDLIGDSDTITTDTLDQIIEYAKESIEQESRTGKTIIDALSAEDEPMSEMEFRESF